MGGGFLISAYEKNRPLVERGKLPRDVPQLFRRFRSGFVDNLRKRFPGRILLMDATDSDFLRPYLLTVGSLVPHRRASEVAIHGRQCRFRQTSPLVASFVFPHLLRLVHLFVLRFLVGNGIWKNHIAIQGISLNRRVYQDSRKPREKALPPFDTLPKLE